MDMHHWHYAHDSLVWVPIENKGKKSTRVHPARLPSSHRVMDEIYGFLRLFYIKLADPIKERTIVKVPFGLEVPINAPGKEKKKKLASSRHRICHFARPQCTATQGPLISTSPGSVVGGRRENVCCVCRCVRRGLYVWSHVVMNADILGWREWAVAPVPVRRFAKLADQKKKKKLVRDRSLVSKYRSSELLREVVLNGSNSEKMIFKIK